MIRLVYRVKTPKNASLNLNHCQMNYYPWMETFVKLVYITHVILDLMSWHSFGASWKFNWWIDWTPLFNFVLSIIFVSCVFPCYQSPSYQKNNLILFCFNCSVSSVANFYITKGEIINYTHLTLIYFQFSLLSFIFPHLNLFNSLTSFLFIM